MGSGRLSWAEVAALLLAVLLAPAAYRELASWTLAGQHHGEIPAPPRWWWAAWAGQEAERQAWRREQGRRGA
jgi:hypothetical protein